MKDSALLLLGGVYLCSLSLASVMLNMPTLICGGLCLSGTALIIASMYELCHYN